MNEDPVIDVTKSNFIIYCMHGLNLIIEVKSCLIFYFKKFINNSRGKYKRNECLINVCKSDKDLS